MLSVKIITPSGLYKECDAQMVNARSVEGAFGVLPKHMPVVAMLDISELQLIFANGERKDYAVAGGLFHLLNDEVRILTDSIEGEDEIDIERAKRAEARARKRLESHKDDINMRRAEIALRKAINRISVKNGE